MILLAAIFKPHRFPPAAQKRAHHPRRQRQERPAFAAGADHPTRPASPSISANTTLTCCHGGRGEEVTSVKPRTRPSWSMCAGVMLAFVIALINKVTRLRPAVARIDASPSC